MYHLRLLGSLSLEDPTGAVSAGDVRQRPLAVLAVLAIAGEKGCSRDKLIGYLWPDIEQDRARHRLTDSVYLLRRSLGEDALLAAGDTLRVNPKVVDVDVTRFLDALDAGELQAAVGFYDGPFLDGFYVSGVQEFERWVESERRRFADAYADALEELAEGSERAEDHRLAVNWWKRLAAHDPYNSRYALRLMQALAAAGDRANALQFAQEHESRLFEELGIEPDAEFRGLVERLRNDAGWELQPREDVVLEGDPGRSHAEPRGWLTPRKELVAGVGSADTLVAADEGRTLAEGRAVGPLRGLVTWRRAVIGGVAAVGLLGVAVSAYVGMRAMGIGPWGTLIGRGVLRQRDLIVLADFEDNAGDSTLALTVTEAMRVRLEQSPVVRVADDAYVGQVLERMEKGPETSLTNDLAREVAIRGGLKAVVTGQVNAAGPGYVLSSRLIAAETGETLDSFLETAADLDAIIPTIDRLSAGVRERIGESLKSVRRSRPLSEVRTASLQALRLYSLASRVSSERGDFRRAHELVSQAIEIDTLFAAAYRLRRAQWVGMGASGAYDGWTQVLADMTKAFELRHRLPLGERYETEAAYHAQVTGDRDKQIEALRMSLQLEPNRGATLNALGNAYSALRDYRRAEAMYRRRLELDSLRGGTWHNLTVALFDQGRFDQAEETLRQWEAKTPNFSTIPLVRAQFAFARGDYGAALAHLTNYEERQQGNRSYQVSIKRAFAHLAQVQGRLAEASGHFRDGMVSAAESDKPAEFLWAAINLAATNVWLTGDTAGAFQIVAAALDRQPLDSIERLERPYPALASFYAFAGVPQRAREFLMEWDTVVPPHLRRSWEQLIYRDVWGAVALAEERYEDALQEFKFVDDRSSCPTCGFPKLGRTYELAGRPDSAVAAYERYLTTPYSSRALPGGVTPGSGKDPYWLPVIFERLGDLYGQRGDTAKAIYYYGRFAEIWKDADPELQPRVQAARRAIEALLHDT